MDDAIVFVHHAIVRQSEVLGILGQRVNLLGRDGVCDGLVLVVGGCVVVGHAEDVVGTETFQSTGSHAVESLGRCHLVTVEAVDIQLGRTVVDNLYDMLVPNLIKECIHRLIILKLVDTIDVGFDRGSDDIGIGTEAVVQRTVVLHLHVNLTHIV